MHGMCNLDFTAQFYCCASFLHSPARFIPLNLLNLHITRTEQFMEVFITRPSPYVYYLLTNKYSLRVLFCMSQV